MRQQMTGQQLWGDHCKMLPLISRIFAVLPFMLALSLMLSISCGQVSAAVEKSRGYSEPAQSKLFQKSKSYTAIQPLVDATPANGQLQLPAGQYEGPLRINKPITITGLAEETILHIADEEQTIILQSDSAALRNLTIADERTEPQAAAVSGEGRQNVTLDSLVIKTRATAIEWINMTASSLRANVISWGGEAYSKRTSRGNGIYLYNSSDIVVEQNEVSSMYDGVYAENSTRLTLQGNKVRNSRYAYHMMYVEQAQIIENESEQNVTGLMIMTSNEVKLHHNKLTGHQANANAAAILIYDVMDAQVYNNQVTENRIGISVERSEAVSVQYNQLMHNFVALQMQKADGLVLEQNDFVGNVTNVWDDGSTAPIIKNNYWDTLQGLDMNGDGYSELTYKSAPFFLTLIERQPSFQLLFGTPGIAFIEQLYSGDAEHWIADAAPSMQQQFERRSVLESGTESINEVRKGIQWAMLLGWGILCSAGIYILLKVRRYEQ